MFAVPKEQRITKLNYDHFNAKKITIPRYFFKEIKPALPELD